MSLKRKKIILAVVLIVLGVFGVGYFIYSDMLGGEESIANYWPNSQSPDLDRMIIAADKNPESRAEIEERIKVISSELKENPELQSSWLELGNWRKEAGDYEGVVEVWKHVISRWPDDKIGYENLGVLYHFYIHDYREAEKYLKLAIEKDPNWALSYLNLHELYKLSYVQKADLAEDVLLDGLSQLPNHVAMLYTLADYYEEKGNMADAKSYYEKVLAAAKTAGDTDTVERVESILQGLD
jgi:tetratricopeptide (TPR) repeat protein